jgi:TonB family protein
MQKYNEKIHLFIRIKWKGTLKYLSNKFWQLAAIESKRVIGGASISILIHAFIIFIYFGFSSLEKKEVYEIQEINFVDLTEKIEKPVIKQKLVKVKPKKESEDAKPQPLVAANVENEHPSGPSSGFSLDKKRLDMVRKQAPINLVQDKGIANGAVNANDLLKITRAKGTRDDQKIAEPLAINISKEEKLVLASNVKSGNPFPFDDRSDPQIQLNGKMLGQSSSPKALPLQSQSTMPKSSEEDLSQPKQTITTITGPLADRQILQKKIPSFPLWAKRKGVGATIALRFTVMENGVVKENIVIERTSGSVDWDHVVIAALREWKFRELNQTGTRQDQTGVITFHFVI